MLLTIAKSGERKTTVQKQFFRAITAHNRRAMLQHQADMDNYKEELYMWETSKKETERAWKKALRENNEEESEKIKKGLLQHQKHRPEKPRSQRILYTDTTPQALVEVMYNNIPSACLLTSEANSIFSGHALKDLDKINTLWDGEDVIVDRATRPSFILADSRLTLSLMAQPVVLERFLSKRGEEARGIGFLARFITVMANEKAGTRETRPIGTLYHVEKFNQRIEQLIDQYFASRENPPTESDDDNDQDVLQEDSLIEESQHKKRNVLTFTSQASRNWASYHEEIEKLQAPNQALHYYKDHASKLMENVGRMAALLHIFEDTQGDKEHIDSDTLDFAYDFCRVASQHFQKHLAGTPTVVKDASDIVERLFLAYEKNQEELRKDGLLIVENKKVAPGNERTPHTSFKNHAPYLGEKGRSFTFKLTFLKRYGPYALRGRVGHQRMMEALNFLQRMGHLRKTNYNYWEISESMLCGSDGPEIRNGRDFTIENLPLFTEQEYWRAYPTSPSQYDHWQIVTSHEPL